MNDNTLQKILLHFTYYSDRQYMTYIDGGLLSCKWYKHSNNDVFRIVVFEDGMVYQCELNGSCIGVHLISFEDVKIRFEEFTGGYL